MNARYFTREQVAEVLGVTIAAVDEMRRDKIAAPALTKGRVQYDRAGLAKMAAYVALRDLTGDRTDRPNVIVREQSAMIERALDALDVTDPLVVQLRGKRLSMTVELPLVQWLRSRIMAVPA